MEKIVGKMMVDGVEHYKIRWVGYDAVDDTCSTRLPHTQHTPRRESCLAAQNCVFYKHFNQTCRPVSFSFGSPVILKNKLGM